MKLLRNQNKKIAFALLVIMLTEMITPQFAYALSSGPSQPEMQAFQPIGNSDMVDMFSGDFSYNIPLMDVGGYPVNLAYQSGAGMDDEASWVGYGWGLNVGSLNRQLRGLPDDFNGTDMQEREMNMKDHITKGAKFSMTLDLLGIPKAKINKKKKKKKLNLALTVSIGVKTDNYRGIGMEVGLNPGLSISEYGAGENTSESGKGNDSLNLQSTKSIGSGGLSLSSQDGATVNLNATILRKNFEKNEKTHSVSKSIGFGYNSRSGLQGMTLSGSFSSATIAKENSKSRTTYERNGSSFISFNSDSYTPTIDHATKNNSYSLSVHGGVELWFAYVGLGLSGFYSKQSIKDRLRSSPAYGYLNSEKAKDINDALVDFNREKDIPYSNEVKYLPIPVPTYDLFSATSQDGSGQYHLYRGSSGVFFDQTTENTTDDFSLGIEFGGGFFFDLGADIYYQNVRAKTQKWKSRNKFLEKGDFQGASAQNPLYEPAYFKRAGEPVPNDADYIKKIKGISPVAVNLPAKISNAIEGAEADNKLRTKTNANGEAIETLKRNKREIRNTNFSYLTAIEAAQHGLDKTIKDFHPDSLNISNCNAGGIRNSFQRTDAYRKAHHFSEITITGDDGKRTVYGLPVYNTYQEEVSFSVTENLAMRNKGLIKYQNGTDNSVSNTKGRENYYSKEKTPAYTTAHLLTAILSPDYVDVTSNGVTDDDLGTAVKFNYSKLPSLYKWRTPFARGQDTANYNEGFLSDNKDDKANYVYGEKEIWYTHSIESKTMVAHFITEDREDALGVNDSRGAVNTSFRLKRLKEIRLYSKSDLRLNGNDASKTTPIKVAHFVYDYSICRGLPNSIDQVGKLTLKRIYFTFGLNEKGRLNPYDFEYDTSYNSYDYRQYDRWGNFKDVAENPGGLNNSEFPYTLQDAITDQFASAWQLKKIILPSGGSINVTYESDDYAYVQNRRASQMCMLNGVGQSGDSTGLRTADYVYVNLPYPVSNSEEMRERYFEGMQNLYFKFFLDLDGLGHKEYVPGYAEIESAELAPGTDDIAKIKLKKIKGTNPVTKAGWQFIRTNLPKYAYPGSDNLDDNRSDIKKVISALLAAFGNIKDMIIGFEGRAKEKGFSDKVDLAKSWVRLCSPEWKKKGGGSRVKRIDISDDWAAMANTTGSQTATYSQVFDYTTTNEKNRPISSGVASYEPLLGNDENPFRQPLRYKQNQILALNNYYYIEEPFGESFFPGANVGYSKVTVKTIGAGDEESVNRTGVTVSEYFTAKDYPTKIDILSLQHRRPTPPSKLFKLVGGVSVDVLGLSQGYSIELNDMHGKPKAVNIYNKSGQNISSVEYFYQTDNEKTDQRTLRNEVKVIKPDGTVSDGSIGMDVELFTDMRQETTENLGVSAKISGGSGAILIFPLPFFFPGIGVNYDRRSFRSSSTIKVINRFAIQYKVKKTENGSSITSENLLWDAETGNVLLTKTQNEFEDAIYSFAYPAHWVNNGMGQAYQNLGTILTGFSTNSNGQVSNATYNQLLTPGDELIDINSSNKYWVVNSPIGSNFQKRLIDAEGYIQQVTDLKVKLLRSGRRNMANTAVATISSLNNPIVGDKLDISELTKVLDAKATVFEEEWSVPVKSPGSTVPPIQNCDIYQTPRVIFQYFMQPGIYSPDPYPVRQLMFSDKGAGKTMYNVFDPYGPLPFNFPYPDIDSARFYGDLINNVDYYVNNPRYDIVDSINHYYFNAGDTITLGKYNLIFESVDSVFNDMINFEYPSNYCGSPIIYITNNPINGFCYYSVNAYFDTGESSLLRSGVNNKSLNANKESARTKVMINENRELTVLEDDTDELASSEQFSSCVLEEIAVLKVSLDSSLYYNTCIDPYGKKINPYYTGILGNWRPQSQHVYQVNRENLVGDADNFGSTNIRKSGAYSVFSPFWKYNSGELLWEQNPTNDNRWVAANEITYFNTKGVEVESKDALNRYSTALFGYLESLPVAVASNSRYREAAYDGFEDYGFTLDCITDTCNNGGHLGLRKTLNGSSIDTTSLYAHSGKYSLKINGTASVGKTVYTGAVNPLYTFDNSGRFLLGSNELGKGFSPTPDKNYILSFWVKDASPRNPSTTAQAVVNGSSLINGASKWPIVEGWKRIETEFHLDSAATSFNLQLQSGGGTVYIDDIRIHPSEGQMKSFAYDPSSQRLMAELDENNFAAFYEYDDEGTLIRVKKETERGIMTIKETRSGYRKR